MSLELIFVINVDLQIKENKILDFDWDIDYNYYIEEAKKLIEAF